MQMGLPNNHFSCYSKPKAGNARFGQTQLVLTPSGLTFTATPSPPRPVPLSPTPRAVQRVTHEPFFSTTDRSLTSFFRLPYDIRIQILRYLLVFDYTISYCICLTTSRFVVYQQYLSSRNGSYPYVRHGLFPAILACSRLCHDECSQILYGENTFRTAWCDGRPNDDWCWKVANSWPLPERYRRHVSKLEMTVWKENHEDEGVLNRHHELFPGLNHVSIEIRLTLTLWTQFLEQHAPVLRDLSTIRFKFDVPKEESERIWKEDERLCKKRVEYGWDVCNADVLCYELYEPVLNKHGWLNKTNRKWTFHDFSDEYGLYWKVQLDLRW